jgi:hypothetical protein
MDTSHEEDVAVDVQRESSPESSSDTDIERPIWVLPVIVASQFASTSLWFAGNAVLDDLTVDLGLPDGSVGFLSSSVQFGFILGFLPWDPLPIGFYPLAYLWYVPYWVPWPI